MTDSRGCEHEGTKVETASNRLNGVADPEGATSLTLCRQKLVIIERNSASLSSVSLTGVSCFDAGLPVSDFGVFFGIEEVS